jgi:hypothetical protein
MALLRCPDCGRDVSDQAPACPGCGRPGYRPPQPFQPLPMTREDARASTARMHVAVGSVLVLIGFVAFFTGWPIAGAIAGVIGLMIFVGGRLSQN